MVEVDPAALDGYAKMLERNADYFATPFKAYCDSNCNKTDEMVGVLWEAVPFVHMAHDSVSDVFSSGQQELGQVSIMLTQSAQNYRTADNAAAEKIWTVYGKGQQQRPEGWAETDSTVHRGVFTDAFVPNPPPPQDFNEFKPAIERAKEDLGRIQDWTKEYVHFDIAVAVSKVSGNWDTLLEDASAYGMMSERAGVRCLTDNLEYGMDSLSASWNDSDAALAFDYHIRGRWIPALETLEHLLRAHKEVFESTAVQAKTTFDLLVILIQEAIKWLAKKLFQILKLIKSVVWAGRAGIAIKELVGFLLDLRGSIENVITLLEDLVECFCEEVDALSAQIHAVKELWHGQMAPLMGG